MARIAGVNIPTNKRVVIALQYIHGIGDKFAEDICKKVGIPPERRVNELTDAEVRQLLGGIPAGFPRPILLRQRIEGGQYDKLVRQMQRATSLTVALAQPGDRVQPGMVHVLPDGVDVQAAPAGLVFAAVDMAGKPCRLPDAIRQVLG